MNVSGYLDLAGRSCPRCRHRTSRIARHWFDRVLSLFMPVVRYRCVNAGCGWEGLLLRRHRMRLRATRPTGAYRQQRLDSARMGQSVKPPRA